MIVSFGDEATADLFHGRNTSRVRRLPQDVRRRALNKLDIVNAASQLIDLRSPPGNRLEALRGDWQGFYSIRVNNQWRIIFEWRNGEAHQVELIDYH